MRVRRPIPWHVDPGGLPSRSSRSPWWRPSAGTPARPSSRPAAPFTDIAGTTFEADIEWLFTEGITKGCTPTLFCPDRTVTRDEMASFLVRMFKLTEGGDIDAFTDDDGTTHEIQINTLAHAGITEGCTATTFCPKRNVRRDEMASFLARAVPLTPAPATTTFVTTTARRTKETSIGWPRRGSPTVADRGDTVRIFG